MFKAITKTWQMDEKTYVEVRASAAVERLLLTSNIVTIVGVSGSGKSSIAHHLALRLGEQGHTIYPVDQADEILKYSNPKEKQVFVLDDPTGKHEISLNALKDFETHNQKLEALIKAGMKLIVTCRKNILNDERFKAYQTVLNVTTLDLSAEEYLLTDVEKMDILVSHTGSKKVLDEYKHDITRNNCMYFPLLCKVFASTLDKYEGKLEEFLNAPFTVVVEELDIIRQRNKHQYCALILCLVFDNYFDIACLDEFEEANNRSNEKVERIMRISGLSPDEPVIHIRNAFQALTGVYFIHEETRYRFVHDILYDAIAFYFGRHNPREMLNHCSSEFIREHVRTEQLQSDDRFAVRIPKREYMHLAKLLYKDLKISHFHDVFLNPCLRDLQFTEIFCRYLRSLKYTDLFSVLFEVSTDVKSHKHCLNKSKSCWNKKWFVQDFLFWKNVVGIHWILAHGHVKIFEMCRSIFGNVPHIPSERGKDTGQRHTNDLDYIVCACLSGNIDIFDSIMQSCDDKDVSQLRYKYFFNLLHASVIGGNKEIVCKVIEMGVSINSVDEESITPLWLSSALGNAELCGYLLRKHGADVGLCKSTGTSPLFIAAQEGHLECVSVLLKHGADVNQCRDTRGSPLYIAAQNGHTKCVSVLLKHGANTNLPDNNKVSPLYVAAQNGHTECVSVLLKHKANVNQCKYNGATPLYAAASKGHTACASILLKHGADVGQCTNMAEFPLYIAAQNGHLECLSVLLKHGADVDQRTAVDASALHTASLTGHANCVSVLLKHQADVNMSDETHASPLFMASSNGHAECVSMLLKHKADANQCTKFGKSPLCIAAQNGHIVCVSILLKHGAIVNGSDITEASPLFRAAQNGHAGCVLLLLKHGADINSCVENGSSPLLIAAENGHSESVSILLNHGAKVNQSNGNRISPLFSATQKNNLNCVVLLLKHGADVNVCTDTGITPLLCNCLLRRKAYRIFVCLGTHQ